MCAFAIDSSELNGHGSFLRRLRKITHNRLIESIENEGVDSLKDLGEVSRRLADILNEMSDDLEREVTHAEREQIEREIIQDIQGMGPLAPLMMDAGITDILVNSPQEIWVDRYGRLERAEISFDDEQHVRRFLDRVLSNQGRRLDSSSPMVDAKLSDGSRLHAVIPPISRSTVVSIRRFREQPISYKELVETGVLTQPMLDFLGLAVTTGQNIVISGGAAAGKTTLLNAISGFIPPEERVVTVEETAELQLRHDHVISMEVRPQNVEGNGGISLRELVRNSLRMRADRVIVGEVRGDEVLDMLQAMNVGHDGSMTTIHANSPKDVLRRVEALAHMGDLGLQRESIREMIGSAIHYIVQVVRFRDGSRRVVSISEVVCNAEEIDTRELYNYQISGASDEGEIHGFHAQLNLSTRLANRAKELGYKVPASLSQGLASHV